MERAPRLIAALVVGASLAGPAAVPAFAAGAGGPQITVAGTMGCASPASAADAALPNVVRLFTAAGAPLAGAVPDRQGAFRFAATLPPGFGGTLVVAGRFDGCPFMRTTRFGTAAATSPLAFSQYALGFSPFPITGVEPNNDHLVNRFNASVPTARVLGDNNGVAPNFADGPDFALIAQERADKTRTP